MDEDNNRISIVTACLNAETVIRSCLDSVASQSITAEHVIVDGNSSDKTPDVVKEYETYGLKVISEPDHGIYEAMNKGICMARGSIIGFLNADDYYADNEVLEKVIATFNDPFVEACYGDLVYVDANNPERIVRYWRAGDYKPSRFYRGWMPPHPTFFVRRSIFEKYGIFNTRLGTSADYELMLRFLLKYNIKAVYVPETLVHMRTGGVSNATFKNRIKAHRMDYAAWKENDLRPYPWTLILKPLHKIGQWINPEKKLVSTRSIRNKKI